MNLDCFIYKIESFKRNNNSLTPGSLKDLFCYMKKLNDKDIYNICVKLADYELIDNLLNHLNSELESLIKSGKIVDLPLIELSTEVGCFKEAFKETFKEAFPNLRLRILFK